MKKRFKKSRDYKNKSKNLSRMESEQNSCGDIKQCLKDSIKVSNQLRQAKRIKKTCDLMDKKAKKSIDVFKLTLAGLESALASRVQSNGGLTTIRDELKACSISAAAKCQTSAVAACQDMTLLDTCKTELQGWIDKFGQAKGCLKNSVTNFVSCVTSLPSPNNSFSNCLSFDVLSKEAIKSKKQCTSSSETGSFGYCKKLQDNVAEAAGAIAAGCSSTSTTMAPTTTGSGECGNVHEATITISRGIYTYRSYFNHYKTINRTQNWIDTILKKAEFENLIKYDEAAANLKSVTKNGTACPGNPSLAVNVTELIAHLTQCGNAITSKIVRECNPNNIPNKTESWPKQQECAIQYDLWNRGFTICFGHPERYQPTRVVPKTCSCFADLNDNGAVSNSFPQSCAFPNYDKSYNHTHDWIDVFNHETNAVLKKCQNEEKTCKDFISEAFTLATKCCLESSSPSGTTRKSNRRIIFENRIQNKLYMKKTNV